jgi:hypothetical protein
MIHYALRCGAGHEFDGWFRSSASFDAQAAQGLLDCPICANTAIERAIMSPRLNKGGHRPPVIEATPDAPTADPSGTREPKPGESLPASQAAVPAPAALPPLPDKVRAVLQRIRTEVEKRCDYVGPRFAETARRIHGGDAPHRPIYGEATPDEAESLAEDGIDVTQIPWVPRADS